MAEILCKYFSGYKPCGKQVDCVPSCPSRSVPDKRVLIVHLGAIGAVVRATSILPAVHEKYPNSQVCWVTDPICAKVLKGHPRIDHVVLSNFDGLMWLKASQWDVVICVDKSRKAVALAEELSPGAQFGFRNEKASGAIVPATVAATELWEIGLNDHKKFFENKKTEVQLMLEAFELGGGTRPYDLPLTEEETALSQSRRSDWMGKRHSIIGVNTGCSNVIPYKKLTVDYQIQMIREMQTRFSQPIVLLGGPEDTERNHQIAEATGAILSPTDQGLRDGLCSVDAVDVVITGCSLGMHMAIARQKWVVAWFGPTCAHEVELYGRGAHIIADVPCTPCWKRSCDRDPMCYDKVSLEKVISAVEQGLNT